MAQNLAGFLNLRHITGLTGTDLELNSPSAKGFAAGQPMWMYDSYGLRMFTLVQNRSSGAVSFTRGMVTARCGGNTGISIVTASTGTVTQIAHASAALVTNQFVGSICYLASTGSTAVATPEGESSIVVSNTSSAVNMDPTYPFSTTPGAGLLAQLISTYNVEAASTGDLNNVVMGAVIAQNGFTTGNFGFVQSYGPCQRVSKDVATSNSVFATGSMTLVGTATGSLIAATQATLLNTIVGRAMAPASSVSTDAIVFLECAQIFESQSTGSVSIV